MYEEVNVAAIADEDAACVRSILAGRPERFRELVERYQGREKLLLRLVQSKYHPGSGAYDPTLPTPR